MNTITLTGRLTRDPEVRELESGTTVCELRLAVDGLGRHREVGYIDVASVGNGAAAAGRVLTKGWLVAVDGRLEHHEWEHEGVTRRAHQVVGHVEFLAAPKGAEDEPDTASEPEPVAAGSDDDTPF